MSHPVDVRVSRGDEEGDDFVFVSSYTDNDVLAHIPRGARGQGVQAWRLDSKTGKLQRGPASELGPNPAFLLAHPALPVMWASTECIDRNGEVITLAVSPDGTLREVGRQDAGGRSTCYLTLTPSGRHLAAVNYWDAVLSLLPVVPETGLVAGAAVDTVTQPGAKYVFDTNPTREEHWAHRQRWPHTHCWVTEPYSREFHFVCDLGEDKIWWYSLDERDRKVVLGGGVQLTAGHGPRHLVFHPRLRVAFVINELKSTISVLQYQPPTNPAAPGAAPLDQDSHDADAVLRHAQTLRTLPDAFDSPDHHRSHAAEIRVHPAGTFVCVANRGHDSIAVFQIDQQHGTLTRLHIVPSGGAFPRNFNFSSSGKYVVVGNQNSNNLTSFAFDEHTGKMTVVDVVDQPSPNFVYTVPVNSLTTANQLDDAAVVWARRGYTLVLVIVCLWWLYAVFFIGNRIDL